MLRGLLLVAVLVAFVGLGVPQSRGAVHGRSGLIAYDHVGARDRFQIYTTTANGAYRQHLTHSRRYSSYDPSYSPSGKRIVFVRAWKQSDLWAIDANGTAQRRLTWTKRIRELGPAWSPDGKQIAFYVEEPAARQGIWVVGIDGRGRRRLTNGLDTHPTWSPDGTKIAFERSDPNADDAQIYVVSLSSGTLTDLTNDPTSAYIDPAWSPDGSRILFSSDRSDPNQLDLWALDLRSVGPGPSFERLTNTPSRDERSPAWSPDGRRIAYSGQGSFHGASSSQIYVSDANGAHLRLLTHACGECAYINDDPSWQPLRG